jgi:ppGpp synthetase/RelA/SpoT-type nucleotidyltranferase
MRNGTSKKPDAVVHDRRIKPSHGYRAVHLVVDSGGFLVEIQVRTPLQHGWASAVEKLADTIDPDIKYGGGPDEIRKIFSLMSQTVGLIEALEIALSGMRGSRRSSMQEEEVRKTEQKMLEAKAHLRELFESFTMIVDKEV